MEEYQKPFTKAFVLRTTIANMSSAVDLSMRKTVARLPEFKGDPDKKFEVLETLASLDELHKMIEQIVENNATILEDTKTHA
jgi:hypothetical protein